MTLSPTQMAAIWPPTAEVAAEAGHRPISPMKAIRAKCLDCCVYQQSEVRACEAVKCALWPFRSGQHPYTSGKLKNPLHGADFTEDEKAEGPAGAVTPPSQDHDTYGKVNP